MWRKRDPQELESTPAKSDLLFKNSYSVYLAATPAKDLVDIPGARRGEESSSSAVSLLPTVD